MDSAQLVGLAMRSVWRRKFSAFLVFALTILVVLFGIAVSPRKYRSEAKLFVRLGRETVTLDPTATTGQTVAVQSSREIEVRSVRDMLASRILLEQVVEQLGPDFVLEPPVELPAKMSLLSSQDPGSSAYIHWLKQRLEALRELAQQVGLSDPVPDADLAVRELEKRIQIEGGSKSSVISIEFVSRSPTAAKQVLETYLDHYRELHVRVNRAPENYAFFENQTEETRKKLLVARSELEQFKNEKGVVAIDVRRQNLQEHVSQIDVQIRTVKANLASAEAALRLSKDALGLIPDRLLTDQVQGLGDPARDSIRNSLFELERQAERVKQAYADGHPEREKVLAQVAAMRKIYDSESKERPTQTSTINQAYQEVQLKVIDTEASRAGIMAELKALQEQREEVQHELKELNATEMALATLQERVDLLQDNHRQYAENLELSRIDDELRKELISNVSIVQKPSLILQPVSPNKKLIGLAGCILAMMNAVAFAMWRNRSEFYAASSPQVVSIAGERMHLSQNVAGELNTGSERVTSINLPPRATLTSANDRAVGSKEEQDRESDDEAESWSEVPQDRSVAPR